MHFKKKLGVTTQISEIIKFQILAAYTMFVPWT